MRDAACCAAVGLAAMLLLAGPAKSQSRDAPPVAVTSWAPRTGPVGTEITLRGTGLNRRGVTVSMDGRRVRPRRVGRDYLTLSVPRHASAGRITLRHPDLAGELVVGTFELVVPARISRLTPRRGLAGSRVELRGRGFRPEDAVWFNDRALRVLERSPTRLLVELPDDARTDWMLLERPGRPTLRAPARFRVVEPAPRIATMAPAAGPGGTRVELRGEHFTPNDRVRYGRLRVTVTESSASAMTVVVPVGAARSDFFTVENEHGRARTSARFALARPPVVRSFSPPFGKPGSTVRVEGRHFAPGDVVVLGERALVTVELTRRAITASIPADAVSGPVRVARGDLRSTATRSFEVVRQPAIDRIDPAAAGAGARVTVHGHHFARDVEVFLAGRRMRLTAFGDTALEFRVPRGARSGPVRVASRGGVATSASPFTVHRYSELRGVRPRVVARGARMTLSGRRFAATDEFWLGAVSLPVVTRGPTRVVVEVPPEAVTGVLSHSSHGTRRESRLRVEVLEPPSIASVEPARGSPGDLVALRVANVGPKARVRLGDRRVRVVKRSADELIVRVPRRARGTAYFALSDAGGRAVSPIEFRVYRDSRDGRDGRDGRDD